MLLGWYGTLVHTHTSAEPSDLNVFVDTDFAGCQITRRSTSGGAACRGNHLIKHWSTTQATVALSSAVAELTGISKGAAQGLGLQTIAADLGITLNLCVHTDATAAIGICRRRPWQSRAPCHSRSLDTGPHPKRRLQAGEGPRR